MFRTVCARCNIFDVEKYDDPASKENDEFEQNDNINCISNSDN